MGAFNACPMAIDILEFIGLLPLARGKQRLHLLPWVQGERAASGSRTGVPSGAGPTVALGKLHLDEGFAGILDGRPTRTHPTLWAGDRLGFPINGEVREVVARFRLIPVCFEGGTNQVHVMSRLTLDEIGDRDIARI